MNTSALYKSAHLAGLRAVESADIVPMIVNQRENPLNDSSAIAKQYFVSDGVCGFASVIVKPANSAFARYLKTVRSTYKHYYGGLNMPVHEFNQSLQKKEAYARAFADVLRANGINAFVDSRLD